MATLTAYLRVDADACDVESSSDLSDASGEVTHAEEKEEEDDDDDDDDDGGGGGDATRATDPRMSSARDVHAELRAEASLADWAREDGDGDDDDDDGDGDDDGETNATCATCATCATNADDDAFDDAKSPPPLPPSSRRRRQASLVVLAASKRADDEQTRLLRELRRVPYRHWSSYELSGFLRTTFSPGVSLRPPLAFNARPRRLPTPSDAFELHPDISYVASRGPKTLRDDAEANATATRAVASELSSRLENAERRALDLVDAAAASRRETTRETSRADAAERALEDANTALEDANTAHENEMRVARSESAESAEEDASAARVAALAKEKMKRREDEASQALDALRAKNAAALEDAAKRGARARDDAERLRTSDDAERTRERTRSLADSSAALDASAALCAKVTAERDALREVATACEATIATLRLEMIARDAAIEAAEGRAAASADATTRLRRVFHSSHWFPYDRVGVVDAVPEGVLPSSFSPHPWLSIPTHLDAFQLRHLTPFNSTPTFARTERP